MSRQATVTTPSILVGTPPPDVDAFWLPRGVSPLGTAPLPSSLNVDASVVPKLIALGFVVSAWLPG